MFTVIGKQSLSPAIKRLDIRSDDLVARMKPGHFVALMADRFSRLAPFNVYDIDWRRKCISIVYEITDEDTRKMAELKINDEIFAVKGPYGVGYEPPKKSTVVFIGEEIGLASEDVRVVGVLDDTPSTASGYLVRPFVGFIPHPYPFRLDGFEIERVIALPLLPLMRHGEFREEVWDRGGTPHQVFFYEHGEDTIWGLTARILRDLVQILAGPLRAGGYLTLAE